MSTRLARDSRHQVHYHGTKVRGIELDLLCFASFDKQNNGFKVLMELLLSDFYVHTSQNLKAARR